MTRSGIRGRGAAAVVFRPSTLSEARFAFHDIQKRHSNSKPSPRSLSENAVSFRSAVFRSAMQRGLLFTGPFVLFMTVESHFTLLNRATSEMMSQAEKAGKKKEKNSLMNNTVFRNYCQNKLQCD